ncbi:FAD-dependent oxidoreductase [Rhodocytophaga aerolata]|uniref:FAD-dependent oxidoreductase n=1 Tax=Rhodocytophaga aerolata TaxID=455078 RepID=A0ABT8RDT3_9BACT|nr:FAD-dependent oxidoreductase [Rhodocytophaga aerolata]MDO1449393.1 FAD-dependent oxidoreductase [Rhodocytophaga aerolata]
MIKEEFTENRRLKSERLQADLVVTGGGLSGTCCAITAARAGIKVLLVQDRPVLGGNSSSEVRLWVLGATSHMGNNNRWAREGGVIDEILVENTYRNPEGNPIIFDTVVLDKVVNEPNITLLLNTAVIAVNKKDPDTIESLTAFCSQNSTQYTLVAPLFCDASGDGIVGFLSGAAFRMGAESKEEFGEKFAPSAEYGELLGHSLYFYSKDTGKPVKFIPPTYALQDITQIPRYKRFTAKEHGCQLWWIEYGGRLDTVHDTEKIKWELWKVIYGVWNYIKNSGNFPEAETLTLEWVGQIPGKRESRRFEGDYILKQQDIVEQRTHQDAIAFGGWSIDLHPADGVFSEKPGCNQWHAKGLYQIPYRCLYSRTIKNLFLAGRIISVSHVAFGSSRVMGTSAYIGQAVGMAAAICQAKQLLPRDLSKAPHLYELQNALLKTGQHIPGLILRDEKDLTRKAQINTSSELLLQELPMDGPLLPLDASAAQLIPLLPGNVPELRIHAIASQATELNVELRISSRVDNHTPDVTLEKQAISLNAGLNCIPLHFTAQIEQPCYAFLCLMKNPNVSLHYSQKRVTGLLSVFNKTNPAVSNYGKQTPPEDIGIDEFEFWCPQRRPEGHNFALKINPGIRVFSAQNVSNGIARPTSQPNTWVADFHDPQPTLILEWSSPQTISKIDLTFDADYDHPMETVLMSHPENRMPFCIRHYRLLNDTGQVVFEKEDNYQTRNSFTLDNPITTKRLIFQAEAPGEHIPAALFEIRCYS